jgi:hypothetical protein
MTTLADRPNTAILVIDLHNDVVAGAYSICRFPNPLPGAAH